MKNISLGILLVAFCGILGCNAASDRMSELDVFARSDSFVITGSPIPRPAIAPATVQSYVNENYLASQSVRSVLADYFLRYDQTLLACGLLDSNAGAGSLISQMWDKELQRKSGFHDTSSTTAMRNYIADHIDWFGDTESLKLRVLWNEQLLRTYLRTNDKTTLDTDSKGRTEGDVAIHSIRRIE